MTFWPGPFGHEHFRHKKYGRWTFQHPPTHTHTQPPNFSSFVWDWEGAQKCFILRNQTTGDLTPFTSQDHTRSPVCAPQGDLSFCRSVIFPIYALPYILTISYNGRKSFFCVWGGEGLPGHPLVRHWAVGRYVEFLV